MLVESRALRILSGRRRGSSRPILVETNDGTRIVKLRGAAQGTGPLVAEILVAELASVIGLRVPARSLVRLDAGIPVAEGDDELADLLTASVGTNLAFEYLSDAVDLTAAEATSRVSLGDQARILWLDRLTMNPDRTARNPNLLWSADWLWLIDHGAALGFQYDWPGVTEDTPRRPSVEAEPHLFAATAPAELLAELDSTLAARMTRELLTAAVDAIPDTFVAAMLAGDSSPDAVRRRRAAYVAFLWKRLKTPRTFLTATLSPPGSRGTHPSWLIKR